MKISNRIYFTGPLYDKDKLEAYVDADVYVLPSIYEAFPNTVLEAWASGTPIIVTDKCGLADIVENADAGYVIKYDKTQLAETIKNMIINKITARDNCIFIGRNLFALHMLF